MSTHELASLYRQYKNDTDSVASWLASTAKACGYPSDLLSTPPTAEDTTQPRPGRLKGKERKLAKKAAEEAEKSGALKSKSYIVALRDFIPLATYIAGRRNPAVVVPDVFTTTISRVIDIRSRFGGLRQDPDTQPDPESDKQHVYFVGILESVRQLLCPSTASAAPATGIESSTNEFKKDAPHCSMKNMENRFASLSVEEPSAQFSSASLNAPTDRPKPQASDPLSYEAETQNSPEDAAFAFMLLVIDLDRIRFQIQLIWREHRLGTFDSIVPAMATDTAISLARGLIDDAAPLFDTSNVGLWRLSSMNYVVSCIEKGYDENKLFVEGEPVFNPDLYDIADETYLVAHYLMLEVLRNVPLDKDIPVIIAPESERYDPHSSLESKTGRQRFVEDKTLIHELLGEQMTVIRAVPEFPVEDEFLGCIRELAKTGKVTLQLVFSAQIFLDIHHITREFAQHGYHAMVIEAVMIDDSIRDSLDTFKDTESRNWSASQTTKLRKLSDDITVVANDPIYEVKKALYAAEQEPMPSEIKTDQIWKRSPVLCGLYLFFLRTKFRKLGIGAADCSRSIVSAAHLYNALMAQGLMAGPWPDMEVLLTLVGESSIWVGGKRPKTPDDWFQRHLVQMGATISSFKGNGRRSSSLLSRAGPRLIKEGAPVSAMFASRIQNGISAGFAWNPSQIDDIISRSHYVAGDPGEDGRFTITRINDAQELRNRARAREQRAKAMTSSKATAASSASEVSPARLIMGLVLALQSEVLEHAFPYLQMHTLCWRILQSVDKESDKRLRQIYTPGYTRYKGDMTFVVPFILMAAAGVNGPESLGPLEAASGVINTRLADAGGRMTLHALRQVGIFINFAENSPGDDGISEGGWKGGWECHHVDLI